VTLSKANPYRQTAGGTRRIRESSFKISRLYPNELAERSSVSVE